MQKEKEARTEEEMIMEGGGNKEEIQSQTLPPGFRFHPSDEELITYYLMNKISDSSFTGRAIADVDLNKCEPWELPGKAKMGEKEWYFFSLRDRKYPTGVRTNRATNTGYWKTTGKDKEIMNTSSSSSSSSVSVTTSSVVGMKKTLVFYKGRAPRGEKTNWVMHEYRMHSKSSLIRSISSKHDEWVVCRVFQKSGGLKKYPSSNHTRSGLLLHPYGLDIAAGGGGGMNMMPHPHPQAPLPFNNMHMMQLGEMNIAAPHFVYGKANSNSNGSTGYMPMMSTSGGSLNLNPLMQSHFNFPVTTGGGGGGGGGGFTISGLNLNLGAGGSSQSQPFSCRAITQNDVVANSNMMTAATNSLGGEYATEISNLNLNPQTQSHTNMDHCVDLDTYWPSY